MNPPPHSLYPLGDAGGSRRSFQEASNHSPAIGVFWGAYRKHDPAVLRESFARLFAWWRQGRLKPHVSHCLKLAEAPRALKLLTERRATGKVVLTAS